MDEASNAIFSEKKVELEEGPTIVGMCPTKSEGNVSEHMKRKDIMTILRASSLFK